MNEDYYTKSEVNAMVANLATKDDIRELTTFLKNLNTGWGVVRISFHTIAVIGGFIGAIFAIGILIKYTIGAWIISLLK